VLFSIAAAEGRRNDHGSAGRESRLLKSNVVFDDSQIEDCISDGLIRTLEAGSQGSVRCKGHVNTAKLEGVVPVSVCNVIDAVSRQCLFCQLQTLCKNNERMCSKG
jgi:hypothetical protein